MVTTRLVGRNTRERERERKREYTEEEGRKKERKRNANSRGDLEEGLRPLLLLR